MRHDNSFKTDELARELKLDKSTIQRSIKRLHEKKLVVRGQINQSLGGYLFTYRIKEKFEIRKIILDIVDSWTNRVKEGIKKW